MWETIADWLAAAAVASLTWASGLLAQDVPPAPPPAPIAATANGQPALMLAWAQGDDQPQIEQVGEGGDEEPLDEGATPTPTPEAVASGDEETLDQGPVGSTEDIELLDQGPQAAAAPVTTEAPAASAPAPAPATETTTTVVAPPAAVATAPPTGPVVPPGFGTGQVHVAAGSEAFPEGLANCHVGAVTGRAYVGIGCGETDDSFVGQASSFTDFPFVVEQPFPFNNDAEVMAQPTPTPSDSGNNVSVFAASARANGDATHEDDTSSPTVLMPGTDAVQLEQRAHDRQPRVRLADRGSGGAADRGKRKQNDVEASSENSQQADNDRSRASAESATKHQSSAKSKHQQKDKDKDKGKERKAKHKKHRDHKKHDRGGSSRKHG
jgi:hypothetical protein